MMKCALLFLLYISCVRGQTLYLKEFNSSAILGDSFQFTCSIDGGGLPYGLLNFNKAATMTVCIVNTAVCSTFSHSPGYSCGCAGGQTDVFYINIASIRMEDNDDSWVCQYHGNTSNVVHLDVLYPPIITSVPSSINLTEKKYLEIDCSSNITEGNPNSTSYTWQDPDGYNRAGPVFDKIMNRTEGGRYTCNATNTAGLSDEAEVHINVLFPPSIRSVPITKEIEEKTSPEIDCSSNITAGNPSSTSYRWTGPGGYSKTGAVLDRTVTRTQGGLYTCNATNTAGLSDTATVYINVLYLDAPSFSIGPSQAVENATVQFLCNVDSSPTAFMTIENVDNSITLIDQEMTNKGFFVIDRAQCLHNGTFQCQVENSAIFQKDVASKSLDILCSPRHDQRKRHKSVLRLSINENGTMVADVIANPLPNFTWWRYVNDQLKPIPERIIHKVNTAGLQSSLKITVARDSDFGKYAVHVENNVGDCILNFKVVQIDKPESKGLRLWKVLAIVFGILLILCPVLTIVIIKLKVCRKRRVDGIGVSAPQQPAMYGSTLQQNGDKNVNNIPDEEPIMLTNQDNDGSSGNNISYRERDDDTTNLISRDSSSPKNSNFSTLSSFSNH